MTTAQTDGLIHLLERFYELASSADHAIETLSGMVIASVLHDTGSKPRFIVLDWSDQGPHLEAIEILDTNFAAVDGHDELLDDIVIWSTNLRGKHPKVRPHPDRTGLHLLDLQEL
jgi:hypothetical protein